MRWLAKAAVQNAISLLPGSTRLNGLLQRYGTRSVVLVPERIVERLARIGGRHLDHQARFGAAPLGDTTVVEIGTGYLPLLPVGFFLAGAGAVHTCDIVELSTAERTTRLLRLLVAQADEGDLLERCPWIAAERLERLRDLAARPPAGDVRALLAEMRIAYHVGDATRTGLEPDSIGLYVTHNVLEHVPRAAIRALLAEAHRIAGPGGVMSHHIDLRDHYVKVDRSIGVYNSLRFTSRQWRVLNSRMEPQNRLRSSDYRNLVREARFDVVHEDSYGGSDRDFAAVRLAPEFRRYAEGDVRVIDMWIAARKRAACDQSGRAGTAAAAAAPPGTRRLAGA